MLDNIIESCKYVVENSKHVKINYEKIDLYLKNIDCKNIKHWLSNDPYNLYELNISTIVNLLLLFELIDYSFWCDPKWNIETDLGKKDESDALLYVMIKYAQNKPKIDFTKVSFEEFYELLKGNVDIPLLRDRYETLVEISNIVNMKMNGNFYEFIKDGNDDISLLNIIIDNFPSFKDERIYNGKIIYFYKLAQLLTQIFFI